MKKNRKIKNMVIIIGLFIISLVSVVLFFTKNIRDVKLKNKTSEIINYVLKLDSGTYTYKKGVLYDNKNNIVTTDYYLNAEGTFTKDIYGNVSLEINTDNRCVYKLPLGKLKVKSECKKPNNIKIGMSRNNSTITFIFNTRISSYLISKEDDLKGKWVPLNSKRLVLNMYEKGKYYIWFTDEKGNLSKKTEFDIDCLLSENAEYDSNILYCISSTVKLDNNNWIVVEDSNKEITLMRLEALDNKMSHSIINSTGEYKWSTSLINKYLNNEYINTLDKDIVNGLKEVSICDNKSNTTGCDADDGCGGYKKETIDKYKWNCEEYTKSKVRLISFDEYSMLYDDLKNKEIIRGNYWTINAGKESKTGVSILYDGSVYTNEVDNAVLDVHPVITIIRK